MLRSAALVVAFLVVPAASPAQTQAGLGVGYSILSGDSYDDVGAGPTLGGHFLFGISENAQVGVGFDYSALAGGSSVGQIDILAAARYLFPSDGARFFVGAKGGFTRQLATMVSRTPFTPDVTVSESSANGFAVGPTAGVRIASGGYAIEFAADGLFHSYGDRTVEGTVVQGTSDTGFRVVPRVAFAILIGE